MSSFTTGFENDSERLSVSKTNLKSQKLSNSHVQGSHCQSGDHSATLNELDSLNPRGLLLETVKKKQAVMEKYRYRSDHHLQKKIKNIRNLVTYRFAEKTFAFLTVIGTDSNAGYSMPPRADFRPPVHSSTF